MGLNFGWKANDVRETIWRGDPVLMQEVNGVMKCRASVAALEAWREDGDADHLRPFCEGEPTVFTYRNLTMDEVRMVSALWSDAINAQEGLARTFLLCFRIGVDLGVEDVPDPNGTGHRKKVVALTRGVRMLAEPIVAQLEKDYPGIVSFYGSLIFNGSFATEPEKKASSPPSTQTPSSAAVTTAATTGASPSAEGASGAP